MAYVKISEFIKDVAMDMLIDQLGISDGTCLEVINKPYEDMVEYIRDNLLYKRHKLNKNNLWVVDKFLLLHKYYDCANCYYHASRYNIKTLPDNIGVNRDKTRNLTLKEDVLNFKSKIVADFKYKDKNCCLFFYKLKDDVYVNNVLCRYAITVHVETDFKGCEVTNEYTIYLNANGRHVATLCDDFVGNFKDLVDDFKKKAKYCSSVIPNRYIGSLDIDVFRYIKYPTVGVILDVIQEVYNFNMKKNKTEDTKVSKEYKVPSYSIAMNSFMRSKLVSGIKCSMNRLLEKANSLSIDEFREFAKGQIIAKPHTADNKIMLRYCMSVYQFEHSLHFTFEGDPDKYLGKPKYTLNDINQDIIIDYKYDRYDYCVLYRKQQEGRNVPDGVVNVVEVYTDSSTFVKNVRNGLKDEYIPYYKIYIYDDGKLEYVLSKYLQEKCRRLYGTHNYEYDYTTVNKKHLKRLKITELSDITKMILYSYDRYLNKKVIDVPSSNRPKIVHSIHKAKEEEYNPIVYSNTVVSRSSADKPKHVSKGGKHKSPIEHDRSGHYRRVKSNKGDFILIDGEYIKVEDKTGTHCYVRPSHINGRKGTIVYKV